jgi:hypothetical protein
LTALKLKLGATLAAAQDDGALAAAIIAAFP